jgi:hypothetical protein
MNVRRGESPPKRGDVESVDYADPDPRKGKRTGPLGRIPAPNERVAISLRGYPFTFTVRVETDRQTGPKLTELTITADDGGAVDYAAVRGVPVRRLAYTAAQWIQRCGGQIALPGDTAEMYSRPDEAAADTTAGKAHRAAAIADRALALGLPVRPTVAAELGVSKTTVDRLLKRAKAQGWFDDEPLPKRPQPPQRDTTATTTEET